MFIYTKEMPNGAVAQYHKAIKFEVHETATHAVVNSYHREEMDIISWQDTYTIPSIIIINNLEDVEIVLTSPGAPFAGGTIVDPFASDLDAIKLRMWGKVKSKRDELINGGAETPLGGVDSNELSRSNILGAVMAATLAKSSGQEYSVNWTMLDNTVVVMDADQIIAVGVAVAQHVSKCHDKARAFRDAIDACTTIEEVNEINFYGDWFDETATPTG